MISQRQRLSAGSVGAGLRLGRRLAEQVRLLDHGHLDDCAAGNTIQSHCTVSGFEEEA